MVTTHTLNPMLSKSMMMMAQNSLLLSSTERYLKSENSFRFHSFCTIGSMYEAKAQRSSRCDVNQSRLFTASTGYPQMVSVVV